MRTSSIVVSFVIGMVGLASEPAAAHPGTHVLPAPALEHRIARGNPHEFLSGRELAPPLTPIVDRSRTVLGAPPPAAATVADPPRGRAAGPGLAVLNVPTRDSEPHTNGAPEIDANLAVAALGLAFGGAAMLRRRDRRRS